MQTKKEDIRLQILTSAEREFLLHGYKNGSMRAIAKRAHTTLGNIYHYFPNKEALLDEIVGDIVSEVKQVIHNHETFDIDSIDIHDTTADILVKNMPDLFPVDLLLSPRFLIFLDRCEGTKYEPHRDKLVSLFERHLASHLGIEGSTLLTRTITQGFISSLLFITTHMKSLEDGRKQLIEYIKLMSLGFPFPSKKDFRF